MAEVKRLYIQGGELCLSILGKGSRAGFHNPIQPIYASCCSDPAGVDPDLSYKKTGM